MIIQVGGSISFTPDNEGQAPKWRSADPLHMLAELEPTRDQVTVTVNTSQMNVTDQAEDADFKGTSRENPTLFNAYKEMTVPTRIARSNRARQSVRRCWCRNVARAVDPQRLRSGPDFRIDRARRGVSLPGSKRMRRTNVSQPDQAGAWLARASDARTKARTAGESSLRLLANARWTENSKSVMDL